MKEKIVIILLILCLSGVNFAFAETMNKENIEDMQKFSDEYGIQWAMNYGSNRHYGARYEGPQPIDDCDNDGKNELLIGGRDECLRVMEWDSNQQTYFEKHRIYCPFYPDSYTDAGGFAIGDISGDGKNEICASWPASVYKWSLGKYRLKGLNYWIFNNGGGSGDCFIGDCDNDGKNELIMSGGTIREGGTVPEIVVYKWTALGLVIESSWDDPGINGYVYMADVGDADNDGENEIVLGSAFKVVVLDWNKNSKSFESTIIKQTQGWENYPFACIIDDSDMDGKNEVHIGYYGPKISIFEWDGESYTNKFEKHWEGEGALIEGLDVGDVDEDGKQEVCAGTHLIHILEWDGDTYIEEALLTTFGELAVVVIGDCDNDGKNEINAGSVMIDNNEDFMEWVYKYGIEDLVDEEDSSPIGHLKVTLEKTTGGNNLVGGSVNAWKKDTGMWYDIPPDLSDQVVYYRNDLPEGSYLLRAFVEGYGTKEQEITITEGEETTITINLKKSLSRDVKPNVLYLLEKIFDNHPILNTILNLLI